MNMTAAQVPPFIKHWFETLKPMAMAKSVPDPSRAGMFSTDMIAGFLSIGNLASERVERLAVPVSDLFAKAYHLGIRDFVLLHDAHHPQSPEFAAFPEHCVRGSPESVTIPELEALPFSNTFAVFEKNSLNPGFGTGFDTWLDLHDRVDTALVVGNCTDFCVYHLAMHLRLRANAFDRQHYRVIVPANAVDTYDTDEDAAKKTGSYPHPGDFFHQTFLYHMALNGITVVRELV